MKLNMNDRQGPTPCQELGAVAKPSTLRHGLIPAQGEAIQDPAGRFFHQLKLSGLELSGPTRMMMHNLQLYLESPASLRPSLHPVGPQPRCPLCLLMILEPRLTADRMLKLFPKMFDQHFQSHAGIVVKSMARGVVQ